VSPRSNPTNATVLTTRDAVAQLLTETGETLTWPVRLALTSAFNYLDDALPTLAPPLLPPEKEPQYADVVNLVARVEALRADLLNLLKHPPDAVAEQVDPYAVGHAAGELGTAVRELSTSRPA
jgi:hypothetical protein